MIPGPKDSLSDPNPSLTLDQDLVEHDQLRLILPSSNVSSFKTFCSVKEKSKTSMSSMILFFLDLVKGIYSWRKLIPQQVRFPSSLTFCNEQRTRTWAGSLLYLEARSTMEGCCMRSPRTRGAQAYSFFRDVISRSRYAPLGWYHVLYKSSLFPHASWKDGGQSIKCGDNSYGKTPRSDLLGGRLVMVVDIAGAPASVSSHMYLRQYSWWFLPFGHRICLASFPSGGPPSGPWMRYKSI